MDYILPIFYYYLRAITAKPVHGTNEEYFNFKYRETLRSQGRMHTSFQYDRTSRLTGKQTKRPGAGILPDIILDRNYSYDNLDRLVSKKHNRQGPLRRDRTHRKLPQRILLGNPAIRCCG